MTDYEIVEILKARRKELKMNQTQLAEAIGTKRQHIGQIESHERVPTITTLTHLCDALGMDIELMVKNQSSKQ